jgi:hypothetical protein
LLNLSILEDIDNALEFSDFDPSHHICKLSEPGVGLSDMGDGNRSQAPSPRHSRHLKWKDSITGD